MDNAQALGTGNVTVNGGILAADPQQINVKGNYTQNAGGTLQLNVAGANPGQYDTLNVGGSAALGGTFKLISLGFQPKAGDTLTLVTTGGSVTGRFARFIDPFATGPGSAESLRSDVGFRAFYQWQIGKIVVEPSLKAAWEHEYKYSALPITVGFAGIPGPSATFFGPSEGHDSAVVSAGVSVQLTPAISTYVN